MDALAAYAREMPRIQAAESIRRATEVAMGSGTLGKRNSGSIWRQWSDAAASEEERAAPPRISSGWLAGMGITVERVKASARDPEAGEGKGPAEAEPGEDDGRGGNEFVSLHSERTVPRPDAAEGH